MEVIEEFKEKYLSKQFFKEEIVSTEYEYSYWKIYIKK
jgi:hypothetical protein